MARLRALDLAKPFVPLVPEVERPIQKVEQLERLLYTAAAVILFVVLSEMPLYSAAGSSVLTAADPIALLRPVLGATRGTALELGVLPIVVSGSLFQIAASVRHINVNLEVRSDRVLFQSTQKLVAIVVSVALAALTVLSGSFGAVSATTALSLVAQITLGSLATILIDEVLQKDWGLGTGPLLFSAIRCSQEFLWAALSPISVPTPAGPQSYGALPNLFWGIQGRSFKFAVVDSVFRNAANSATLPSVLDFLSALVAFLVVLYVSTFRVDLPIRSTRMRAASSMFPVRLLYTGGNPIIFVTAILAAYQITSEALYSLAPENMVVRLLGTWVVDGLHKIATGGLAYYVSPPSSLVQAALDPLRSVAYVASWLAASAWFAHAWVGSSGFAPLDLAKQFKDNSIVLLGKRDVSVQRELRRIIPTAAATGGAVLGIIVALSDIVGRSGWGLIMAVGATDMLSVFEILGQEGIAGPGGLVNQQQIAM